MGLKLSSVIPAKNEAANIERCILSQLGVIDDIVVAVDSSTTDATAEIASRYPVRVLTVQWKGYAETKQEALAQTTHEWVLWLDADEAITPELKNELLAFKDRTPAHDVYSLPRRAFFLGRWIKHSGWYPGRVPRLFNKNKVRFNSNKVHEGLVFNGTTGELTCDLDHFTDPSIAHYYEKFNRYTSLAAEDLMSKNKVPGIADLLVRPLFIFLKMYIFRLGFLDGIQGLILAVFSANYVFTKYAKGMENKLTGNRQ